MKSIFFILFILCGFLFSQNNGEYVILVSLDGFRHDYPDRGITPNLAKLEKTGVRALSLRPCFPTKTFPNHLSIITGLYPENHGIISNSFANPYTGEFYRMGDTSAVRNAKWYSGEALWETAEKQGIKCASYFWPGSEVNDKSRRPTYFQHYDHNRPYRDRISGVLDWLQLPYKDRPHFITTYFHETDSKGHNFGPDSPQNNRAIALLDTMLGMLIDGVLKIGLSDSVNIIVVSDHGMTDVSIEKTINIEKILHNYRIELHGSGPMMMLDTRDEEVINTLKKNNQNFRVYRKQELPAYYNFSKHPFISPLILVADPGYSLVTNRILKRKRYSKGNHGFEKDVLDMHGIFIASGPSFKKNYMTGTVWNIDIYPLICKILHIYPAQNIDGNPERIEFVLKEK